MYENNTCLTDIEAGPHLLPPITLQSDAITPKDFISNKNTAEPFLDHIEPEPFHIITHLPRKNNYSLKESVSYFEVLKDDYSEEFQKDISNISAKSSPFLYDLSVCKENPLKSSRICNEFLKDDDQPVVKEILDQIGKKARMKLHISKLFVLGNLAANILGFLALKNITSFLTLFIVVLIFTFAILVLSFSNKFTYRTKREKILLIIHLCSIMFFLLFVILKYEQVIGILTIGVIPGLLTSMVDILFGHNKPSFIVLKAAFWVQLLLVGLEVDKVFILPWCLAIIILNAIAVFCLIIVLLVLMLWVTTLCDGSYSATSGKVAIVGSTWHLLLVLSTLTWALTTISFENLIGIPISTQDLWYLLVVGAGYCTDRSETN